MSNKSDRISFQSRYKEMLETLRHEIVTSVLSAGEFIPSELALSEHYQISRKSVRKALDILVAEGLLTKVPRVGNRVNQTEAFKMITIRLGYYPSLEYEAVLPDLVKLFEEKHSHISIELIALPYRNYTETVRGFIANGWLDAVTINNKDFMHAQEDGLLELFDYQDVNPAHYSFLPALFSSDNQLYVQPLIFSAIVLCYNKDMFERCNLAEPDSSWTWSDLSAAAHTIKEKQNILGFYADIASLNRFPIYLLQRGFSFKSGNKHSFTDDLLWDSLLAFRDLFYNQGESPAFLSEADLDTERLFLNEKTAMILTSYFALQALKSPSFVYDIAPIPHDSEESTLLLATGIAISKYSKQKDAAALLVDFLAAETSQLYIRQQTLSIPADQRVAEQEMEAMEVSFRPANFNCYRDMVSTFRNYKDLNLSISTLEYFQRELKLFWSNLEEPDVVKNRLTLLTR